jgi:hypothetical protein
MPSDSGRYNSGRSDSDRNEIYRSAWAKTPTGDYTGEPNYLSADVFNLLINEMHANRNNLVTKNTGVLKGQHITTNVSIPGYVGSGTKYSAADWNNVCNQVAVLISDTKRILGNSIYKLNTYSVDQVDKFKREMSGLINVSESEAYALRYGSGELLSGAKTLTRLINIVRRARIHCTCHIENYRPCNHCEAYRCRRDGFGCGSDR